MPKIERGPIMAAKPYLIIHQRGDSDGEIAPFSRSSFPAKASGRSKLTREPKQIDAQLGKQTGAQLSALLVSRCLCLVPPSGLCRPVWISRMTKPEEDRVAGEFNPAGRLTGPCDKFFN
jgi:hypothetical protein